MILGLGMDVREVERFRKSCERHPDRMRTRLFTQGEQEYCESNVDPMPHYAARFAAKEAFAKALGSGIAEGIHWVDVEVVRDKKGAPSIVLHGNGKRIFAEKGGKHVWLTLTHSEHIAAATVVLEG